MTYEKVTVHEYGAVDLLAENGVVDTYLKLFFPYVKRQGRSDDYTDVFYYFDEEQTRLGIKLIAFRQCYYDSDRTLYVDINRSSGSYTKEQAFSKRWYDYLYAVSDDEGNLISLILIDRSKNPIFAVYKDTGGNICGLLCTSVSGSGHARFGVYTGSYDDIGTNFTPFAVHANFARGQAVSLAKLPTNDSNNSRAINIFLTPFTPYYPSSDGGLVMDTYKINDSTYLMNQIMAVQLT